MARAFDIKLRAIHLKHKETGTSLAVQWLRLCISDAGGTSVIPSGGTKIPHTTWLKNLLKKKNKESFKISEKENAKKGKVHRYLFNTFICI